MRTFVVGMAAAAALAACAQKPPEEPPSAATPATTEAPAATIPPAATERYTCERGTKLTVKLLGATAEVGVNGQAPVSLPALGDDGTTWTNGRMTLTIVQGKVSYAVGRMAAEACTQG